MTNTRILLADDHAVVRAGIRKVVEEIPGLEVVAEVGDGIELMRALQQYQPDCLLIDVAMPNFEPIATIRQLRQASPQLKILVISAYDDDLYVQGLLGAGVNGYHLKDQPLSDMKLAVQRVVAGETWLSGPLIAKLVNPGRATTTFTNGLTPRQQELLRFLYNGLDNQSIAQATGLSIKTVENHLTRLYRQLNVQSRLEAVNYANQHPEILGLQGKDAQHLHQPQPGENGKAITILIVDDNPRFRVQLHRAIGKVCPTAIIYEAGDIAAAVQLSQRLTPALALVDVVLSEGEDGLRCTRRIKAISPTTRVVLISAYPDREFHRQGLESGAVAFLDKKDLDSATLKQVIEDLSS